MQNGHDYHGYEIRLYSKQGCDIANIHNIRTNLSTDLSMVEVCYLNWVCMLKKKSKPAPLFRKVLFVQSYSCVVE